MKKSYFNKTSKAPSAYKTKYSYLRALYRANKEKIDEVYYENVAGSNSLTKPKSAYKMLKKSILNGDHINSLSYTELRQRVTETSRSEFYGKEDVARENLHSAIKQNPEIMKQIRKSVGWKKKVDWENMQYHDDPLDKDNRYFYFETDDGNIVGVKFGAMYKNKKEIVMLNVDMYGDVVGIRQ